MERQEKKFLESIKKGLEQDLLRVNQLLKQASAPRLERPADGVRRAESIVKAIRSKGGRVSREQLATIAVSMGIIATAVGALYQAGYVKKDPRDNKFIVVGPKGQAILRKRR